MFGIKEWWVNNKQEVTTVGAYGAYLVSPILFMVLPDHAEPFAFILMLSVILLLVLFPERAISQAVGKALKKLARLRLFGGK